MSYAKFVEYALLVAAVPLLVRRDQDLTIVAREPRALVGRRVGGGARPVLRAWTSSMPGTRAGVSRRSSDTTISPR